MRLFSNNELFAVFFGALITAYLTVGLDSKTTFITNIVMAMVLAHVLKAAWGFIKKNSPSKRD